MAKNVTTLDDPAPNATPTVETQPQAEELKAAHGSADFCGKRAVVNIAMGQEDGGKHAVFVGVAGTGFQIPRGKSWNVPVEVANALRDAVITSYPPADAAQGSERTDSPRFSFTAIDLDADGRPIMSA